MGLGEDIVTKVYDINTHPYLMEDVCSTEEDLRFAVEITGLYKTGIFPMKANFNRLNCAKIDISVLSPLDLTTTRGRWFVTNEQTKKLQDTYPDRFLGMASVDPMREDASVVLEHAFADLELSGLYLHPSLQKFYPDDERCEPIWNICEKYNKPILFDAGLSPYPNLLTKYAHPLRFEEIACRHPNLRICLSFYDNIQIIGGLLLCQEKKPIYKVQMTEGKRSIIHQLLEEYDIQMAEDIQDVLNGLRGS